MELETNSENIIDDAARLAAETRQLTIAPLHGDVSPEDEPDSVRVAQHMSGPPIANISNDTEDTANLATH